LSRGSRRILDAVADLRALETEKRKQPISTPAFHRLAEDVTAKSQEVFSIARNSEDEADLAPRSDDSIDDVEREEGSG
jgi:hypothetical protein